MTDDTNDGLRTLVAEVAAAYFANSHVNVADIGSVIEQIAKSLEGVGTTSAPTRDDTPAQRRLTPAQIRKSVTPDALISFEDGRPYKTMRRRLAGKGLTPEEYRQKWGLPSDYPMVSANYSASRSQMAKSLGLGNKGGRRAVAAPSVTRRGRGRAATTATGE